MRAELRALTRLLCLIWDANARGDRREVARLTSQALGALLPRRRSAHSPRKPRPAKGGRRPAAPPR
jgi:hypothetical protein